jgi:plastocyanin
MPINSMTAAKLTQVYNIGSSPLRQVLTGPNNWQGLYGLFLDGPLCPYRDGSGIIYVPITHSENYRCRIGDWGNPATWVIEGPTYISARNTAESAYNNRHWLFGFRAEGSNVYALTHHEWYKETFTAGGVAGFNAMGPWTGMEPPPTGGFNTKWVNAVGHAKSTNGGASFSVSPVDDASRVVLVPEPWDVQAQPSIYGFLHPSNIAKEGAYYYAMLEQRSAVPEAGSDLTLAGMSMIRTTDVSKATGWEYWTGSGWQAINHNTYQGNLSSQKPYMFFGMPDNAYTNPQPNSHLGQSLRYHTPSGLWVLFGFAGHVPNFFCYSTSPTLANPQWGGPFPITIDAQDHNEQRFQTPAHGAYISVFDEGASDQNFQDIGNNCTVMVTHDNATIWKASLTIASTVTPTYSITPSATAINEGGSVTFSITTSNVGSTTLYWTNAGTTAAADFSGGQNSGTVAITNNSGSLVRAIASDALVEGGETIVLQLRTGSTSGPIVATAQTVTVNDTTSSSPTYAITPSTTTVGEGGTISFNVATTNVANGTTLYWTNAGTTIGADFSDGQNSGSVVVWSNSAVFSRALVSDEVLESGETVVLQLRTGSTSGPVVATASAVNVSSDVVYPSNVMRFRNAANNGWIVATAANTKIRNAANTAWIAASPTNLKVRNAANTAWMSVIEGAPSATYAITPSTSTVNEGQSVTFTVTTTGVPNGTTLYWTNAGSTVAADFTAGINSGAVTINNNTVGIVLGLIVDSLAEGNETIVLQLRTGSTAGPVVATASAVTVVNTTGSTYTPPDPYTLTMARNDLDFIYAKDVQHNGGTYLRLDFTLDIDDFFTAGGDHIPFVVNAKIVSPHTNHCGPIVRNGRELFSYGRGFFIRAGSNQVFAEHWNGTASPPTALVTRTGGTGFNTTTNKRVRMRIVGGLRTGPWANQMVVYIWDAITSSLLFQGSVPWGWDPETIYMAAIGGIASGFQSPNSNGCVERTGPGNTPSASCIITGISHVMI